MINDIFEALSPEGKNKLVAAFGARKAAFVEYETGRFIGVYVETIEFLTVEETINNWSIGVIK